MKILEINKFNNNKRGADKHYLDVCELLRANGHEVAQFSMHAPDNAYSEWQKYFVTRVGYTDKFSVWEKIKGVGRMFFSFEARQKINKLLDDFMPQLVHVHNIYHQLSPTILFEIKKRGIPIIMTIHDFKLINPNHALVSNGRAYDRCRNHRYYQCFFDRAIKNSYAKSFIAMCEAYWHHWLGTYRKNIDVYIAPSEFVKSTLIEWGIDEQKIVVIPHFAQHSNAGIVKNENPNVLVVGHVSRAKGTPDLIEAMRNIKAATLYIAGDVEPELVGYLNEHDHVRYLGFLQKEALQKRIMQASCVISPSKLPETFGLVPLETVLLGTPFVGYAAGAYGEIIENGKNGYLAQNREELIDYVSKIINGEVLFDSVAISREANLKFSSENYYQNFLDVSKRHMAKSLTKSKK